MPTAVPVLVVHDEIVLEVAEGDAAMAADWLRGHMEAAAREILKDVPVEVELTIAASWAGERATVGG